VAVAVTALTLLLTSSVAAVPVGVRTLDLLQMNLCNSGESTSCYSFGYAVTEAVQMIHRYRPQAVTVQEICRDDLYAAHGWGRLAQAMADLYGDSIEVDFTPARNRLTGAEYHGCLNGELYGIGILHQGTVNDVHRGWYTTQSRGGEVRAWTCSTVLRDRLTVCTTHLTINRDIAARQCVELMATLATAKWRTPEVIISGDLNLQVEPGRPQDVQRCVPPGFDRHDDGSVQQVFSTDGVRWVDGRHEPLPGTDHPLLIQSFQV
jgi:hypothetical protein